MGSTAAAPAAVSARCSCRRPLLPRPCLLLPLPLPPAPPPTPPDMLSAAAAWRVASATSPRKLHGYGPVVNTQYAQQNDRSQHGPAWRNTWSGNSCCLSWQQCSCTQHPGPHTHQPHCLPPNHLQVHTGGAGPAPTAGSAPTTKSAPETSGHSCRPPVWTNTGSISRSSA